MIMFKKGETEQQKTIFDQEMQYPAHVLEKLQKSWADDFYKHIFSQINEERFLFCIAEIQAVQINL
jgi:hypothetical protein